MLFRHLVLKRAKKKKKNYDKLTSGIRALNSTIPYRYHTPRHYRWDIKTLDDLRRRRSMSEHDILSGDIIRL